MKRGYRGIKEVLRQSVSDTKKYFSYTLRLTAADLKSEVVNSYLDWIWWILEPLCTMLIYTLIFGVVFRASEQYFPIFIFIGITIWGFFAKNITAGVTMVRSNRSIITRIYIPKHILLLSKMLVNGFKALVSFGVIIVMMVLFGVVPTVQVFWVLPLLLILFLFTFGLGSIMMHYGVYMVDLAYITGILLNMLMYLTGTFYSVAKRVPAPFGGLLEKCNPIAFLIASARNALLYGTAPDIEVMLIWAVISCGLTVLGVWMIYNNENAYVKVI